MSCNIVFLSCCNMSFERSQNTHWSWLLYFSKIHWKRLILSKRFTDSSRLRNSWLIFRRLDVPWNSFPQRTEKNALNISLRSWCRHRVLCRCLSYLFAIFSFPVFYCSTPVFVSVNRNNTGLCACSITGPSLWMVSAWFFVYLHGSMGKGCSHVI